MLKQLELDAPLGSKIKLYLVSGSIVDCILMEINENNILVEDNGATKRFFAPMIGGWEVLSRPTPIVEQIENNEVASVDNDENNYQDAPSENQVSKSSDSLTEESKDGPLFLAQKLRNYVSSHDANSFCEANAVVISADNANVLIRTLDTNTSYFAPFKYIGTQDLRKRIESIFLSGNDNQDTTLPVHVGFYLKDQQAYPNIVLEPDYLVAHCEILVKTIKEQDNINLAKNILFDIRKSLKGGQSKSIAFELMNALKLEDASLRKLNEQIALSEKNGSDTLGLLRKKAQRLSALNRFEEALVVYESMVMKLDNGDKSNFPELSHTYTVIASIYSKTKRQEKAKELLALALDINPENSLAAQILYSISNTQSNDNNDAAEIPTLISQITAYLDPVLEDDIVSFKYSDPEIISNNGEISQSIANRLYVKACSDGSVNSFLESAKAFHDLGVFDEETSMEYAQALYGYANTKSRMLFALVAKSPLVHTPEQLKIIDSAYCYFVAAINFGSITDNGWAAHFRDYMRLRMYWYAKDFQSFYHNVLFENSFEEFVETHNLSRNHEFLMECSNVIISVGARCPIVKDGLRNEDSKTIGTVLQLLDNIHDKDVFARALNQSNRCKHIVFNETASIMLMKFVDYRKKKLGTFISRVTLVRAKSVDALFEESILAAFKRLKKSAYYLSLSDLELAVSAEKLMHSLVNFKSRTQDERRLLAPNLRASIEKNMEVMTNQASYLYSSVLKETWIKLLQSKYLSAIDVSTSVANELSIDTDGSINEDSAGRKVLPISILNEGKSTIDRFHLTIIFSELPEVKITHEGKSLAPMESTSYEIVIPEDIRELEMFDYTVEIRGIVLGSSTNTKTINLTSFANSNITFKLEEVLWDYQSKETRKTMFKGRQADMDKLIRTFTTSDRKKIPIVFGLTRTGKSSILLNLKKQLCNIKIVINHVEMTIVPIYIDISSLKGSFNNHDSFMLKFSLACYDQFYEAGVDFGDTLWDSLDELILDANHRAIYPLLMFDEFSYMKDVVKFEGPEFLKLIREFAFEEKAGFIYAGTYDILDLIRDPDINPSGTFMNLDEYKIYDFKDPKDAEDLMDVMTPKIVFTNAAKKSLHELSGDVPYWIQLICNHCAHYAFKNNRPVLGTKEIDDVVNGLLGTKKIDSVTKLIDDIFLQQQLLPSDPKETKALVFSIAYLMKDKANKEGVSWNRLKEFWAEHNYHPQMASISMAKDRLVDRLCLKDTEIDDTKIYRFSVGIFRKWCERKDVFSEFDKTNTSI